MFHTVVRVVAHNFARISLGFPLCRNEEWLRTAFEYPESVFRTVIQMRLVPNLLKPFIAYFIPDAWAVSRHLRKAKKMIIPVIQRRRQQEESSPDYEKPYDFLQWMMDEAKDWRERKPENLVHRLLVLALASVHTSSMAATQVIFDLCARPEWKDILRDDIAQAIRRDGGWKKTSLSKMWKLDSFMRESQRMNPPSLRKKSNFTAVLLCFKKTIGTGKKIRALTVGVVGFKRSVETDIVLSDGLVLPKGAHTVMPIVPITMDPSINEDPSTFDGLRCYKKRLQEGHSNQHQFATTSTTNMHFGHGKYSCPGRFFATNTVKIILVYMLMNYDFRIDEEENKTGVRPPNVPAHEYLFPNPHAKVFFRERTEREKKLYSGEWEG